MNRNSVCFDEYISHSNVPWHFKAGVYISGDEYDDSIRGILHPGFHVKRAYLHFTASYYEVSATLNGEDVILMGETVDRLSTAHITPQYRLAEILRNLAAHIDSFRDIYRRNCEMYAHAQQQ